MSEDAQPAILHPTDLSQGSEPAFHLALKLALGRRSRLYILHTDRSEDDVVDWDAFPSVRSTLARWNLLEAGSAPEDVAGKLGIGVRKVDVVGRDPVRTIAEFIDTHSIGMIVLATHGREGLDRWLKGEIAEPLARRANLPTVFLPPGARVPIDPQDGSVRLQRMVIPVDARPRPEAAVQAAHLYALALGRSDVPVELLHVGAEGDSPAVRVPDDLEGRIEGVTRSGPVVETILEHAADEAVGLVAMATEGHRGLLDAWRGSTTEQVLRRASCPVLAVPAK